MLYFITGSFSGEYMDSGEDHNENAMELISKSASDQRVREPSIRAIQMLSHRVHWVSVPGAVKMPENYQYSVVCWQGNSRVTALFQHCNYRNRELWREVCRIASLMIPRRVASVSTSSIRFSCRAGAHADYIVVLKQRYYGLANNDIDLFFFTPEHINLPVA